MIFVCNSSIVAIASLIAILCMHAAMLHVASSLTIATSTILCCIQPAVEHEQSSYPAITDNPPSYPAVSASPAVGDTDKGNGYYDDEYYDDQKHNKGLRYIASYLYVKLVILNSCLTQLAI